MFLYNKGKLPLDWKHAHVSPIYKNGDKNKTASYRLISLTSIVCKLMESIIKESIMEHMIKEKLYEYGFINGRSTTTQLLRFLEKCAEAIANGNVVDVIYFFLKRR